MECAKKPVMFFLVGILDSKTPHLNEKPDLISGLSLVDGNMTDMLKRKYNNFNILILIIIENLIS